MRFLTIAIAALLLAGCSSQPRSADSNASAAARGASAPAGDASTPAVAASGPKEITELTNQTMVYECPKCGMDFESAGTCTMDGTALVATRVDYVCPMDHQAVEKAGKCPRCAMNARVEKTAMAAVAAPGQR